MTLHLILIFFHKHTQWPGPGREEKNVVGYPFLPVYVAKTTGFFFIVFGTLDLWAALSRSTRSGSTAPTTRRR